MVVGVGYAGARKSKNVVGEERTEIGGAAHADWTRSGARISRGERPSRRGVERCEGCWLLRRWLRQMLGAIGHDGKWVGVGARQVRVRLDYIFSDGKPRRSGYSSVPEVELSSSTDAQP